jgi:hypothetical protein
MKVLEALTKLVVGMSRFGDHLLRKKVSGIIVAALAFACGAGLVHALKREPRATPAVAAAQPADPARAEVSIRDTSADEAKDEEAVFKGRYKNYVYGYFVEIPAGMIGVGSTPPAPQHGFGIDLDNPRSTAWNGRPDFPKSYLYVDGSYNSLEWRWHDDAVNSHLSFLREKGENVRVRSRALTRLGGVPAVRVVALYREGGEEMVSDEVVTFAGGDYDGPALVFTLSLSTPLSKYERDRPALEALMKSWCLQPFG